MPYVGNGPGSELLVEVNQVLLEILETAALRDIVGKLVQIAKPVPAVFPIGKTCVFHDAKK
jgi:hypothetical protein